MSEANLVERDSIEVVLCGRTFKWPRPVRRVAREMLASINRIQAQSEGIDPKAMTPEMVAQSFDGINEMLAFLYKYHPEIGRRRLFFDDNAKEQEIAAAFRSVSEFVARPFSGSTRGTGSGETLPSPEGEAST